MNRYLIEQSSDQKGAGAMPSSQREQQFSLTLTHAQRKAVAELTPDLAERLQVDKRNRQAIQLPVAELKKVKAAVQAAFLREDSGTRRRLLRHVLDVAAASLNEPTDMASIPPAMRVYQFRITLIGSFPPIWRRIQVKDCNLDELHEHVQTAMGWTNSHLHHFIIEGRLFGDPDLMRENFEDLNYNDSTQTKISAIVPENGERFRFEYEYDFGDSWMHEILFEGVLRAEPRRKYPLCLEGARACPPDDVGGIWGYADFVEAIQDPENERHHELLEWVGGRFDPEAFDPAKATLEMRRGLPDWKEWV